LNNPTEGGHLSLSRQTYHHDWLSAYRGLQTSLFVLSLGIELTHFLRPKPPTVYPNWRTGFRQGSSVPSLIRQAVIDVRSNNFKSLVTDKRREAYYLSVRGQDAANGNSH